MVVENVKNFHVQTLFKLNNEVIATFHSQVMSKEGIFSVVACLSIKSTSLALLSEISPVASRIEED